jgi:hypothetical protein
MTGARHFQRRSARLIHRVVDQLEEIVGVDPA